MITDLKTILTKYKKSGTVIGAFNTPNSESIYAVISAAETLNVPVIIAHAQLHENVAPLDFVGKLMIASAEMAKVPVCVHLDHGEDFDYIKRAVDLGFTSVMYDGSQLEYAENKAQTKRVVEYAHGKGVSVEAELGRLATREGGESGAGAEYTDENLVNDFIDGTNVDALAIAFGTAHGYYEKPPMLSFDVIDKVRRKTNIPLVMHGGSGITKEDYAEIIKRGVSKINFYSYMAYAGFDAAKVFANQHGKAFYHDLAHTAFCAMKVQATTALTIFSNLQS